jgi:hypothetical protein
MILVVIFLVVAFVAGALTHVAAVAVVLGLVVTGGYWVYDVKRHPTVACRVCGGSGLKVSRVQTSVTRTPAGLCGRCGGKKVFPRPALRVIDSSQREQIVSGIKKAREARKR